MKNMSLELQKREDVSSVVTEELVAEKETIEKEVEFRRERKSKSSALLTKENELSKILNRKTVNE